MPWTTRCSAAAALPTGHSSDGWGSSLVRSPPSPQILALHRAKALNPRQTKVPASVAAWQVIVSSFLHRAQILSDMVQKHHCGFIWPQALRYSEFYYGFKGRAGGCTPDAV